MINPLNRDGVDAPSEPSLVDSTPLTEAMRQFRRGYEIEDATLVEMAALLGELKRKYRDQMGRHIEDRRLLKSSIQTAELHHGYLKQEADIIGAHIANLWRLHRQANSELRTVQKWVRKLHPGWRRVFDEAKRRAIHDNIAQK